jgi:hypothetical protein
MITARQLHFQEDVYRALEYRPLPTEARTLFH